MERAVQEVLAADLPVRHELIVVDDGSPYGTGAALERVAEADRVTLLRHERKHGKGAAVQTAPAAASGEFSAIFDPDLEYDPADLRQVLEPLIEGRANAASACAPSMATRATRSSTSRATGPSPSPQTRSSTSTSVTS